MTRLQTACIGTSSTVTASSATDALFSEARRSISGRAQPGTVISRPPERRRGAARRPGRPSAGRRQPSATRWRQSRSLSYKTCNKKTALRRAVFRYRLDHVCLNHAIHRSKRETLTVARSEPAREAALERPTEHRSAGAAGFVVPISTQPGCQVRCPHRLRDRVAAWMPPPSLHGRTCGVSRKR